MGREAQGKKARKKFKKSVDRARCTCYYIRVASSDAAERTLTNKQQCNPENSKRSGEKSPEELFREQNLKK